MFMCLPLWNEHWHNPWRAWLCLGRHLNALCLRAPSAVRDVGMRPVGEGDTLISHEHQTPQKILRLKCPVRRAGTHLNRTSKERQGAGLSLAPLSLFSSALQFNFFFRPTSFSNHTPIVLVSWYKQLFTSHTWGSSRPENAFLISTSKFRLVLCTRGLVRGSYSQADVPSTRKLLGDVSGGV